MVYPGDSPSHNVMFHRDGSSTNKREHTKKVEWSSNLSSVESFAPEDRSPNWDSETDHLLSYFLGGEQQNNGVAPSPLTQFATTPAPTASGNSSGMMPGRQGLNTPFSGPRLARHGFSGAPGRLHRAGNGDDDHVPPPTPATQYYYHSSKSKSKGSNRRATHFSSSSKVHPSQSNPSESSISYMRDSLVNAGTASSHHSSSDPQQLEPMSPISPAAIIGSGHEELMLPSAYPHTTSGQQPQSVELAHQPRQSHLEWLQHINALAKQAHHPAASNPQAAVPNPATPAPSQQTAVIPSSTTIPYHGIPGLPSLPAAYGHAPMYYAQAALNQLQQQQSPAPESEEKRAKRLERNRESARKSRRRKKERLSQLGGKVTDLHNQIESARSVQINAMNPQLENFFLQRIVQLDADVGYGNIDDRHLREQLTKIFRGTRPNCETQRAVIDFQYSKLKQSLLPRYQKFLMWLTLHPENWFNAGKEQYSKRESAKQVARVTSGKISSKQVGDELTNGSRLEDGTFIPAPQSGTSNANGEKGCQVAEAFDACRMWPLFCFELSVSVDQEERMIQQAYKNARKRQDLQHSRSQIEAATRMASRLKEAVLLQSHNVAVRSERTYLDVMTPKQSIAFHKWWANNRQRFRDDIERPKTTHQTPATPAQPEDTKTSENLTLIEVCKKLEAVLKISKGEKDAPNDIE